MDGIRKMYVFSLFLIGVIGLLAFTCEVPGLEDPDNEFFITKAWKAKEITQAGDVPDKTTNYDVYRLIIEEDFSFKRIDFVQNGEDPVEESGTWNLIGGQSQLVLIPQDADGNDLEPEYYLIVALELRELQLKKTGSPDELKHNSAGGDLDIRYILEPVKN
jgi:hypothetical protein